MYSIVRRAYWWWMRHTSVSAKPGGVPLIFISAAGDRTADQVAELVQQAFAVVERSAPDEAKKIRRELKFVAALNSGSTYAIPDARGLAASFTSGEASSPELFASQLVWAAEFVGLRNAAVANSGCPESEDAAKAATERRRTFLAGLPGGDRWLPYV